MATQKGITFLHKITVGTIPDPNNPAQNFLSATSTAAGDFAGEFMFTDTLRQVWRSTDTTQQEIVIQSDFPVRIDTFAILGHNFSSNAVVTFEANSVNDFSSPPISVNMTVTERNMVLLQDLGFEFEFYKITILDPTNECGFIEIGRLAGGLNFQFSNNEDITDNFSIGSVDFSQQIQTEGFNRPSNSKVLADTLNATFAKISTKSGQDDNFQGLRTLIDNVKTTRPFLTILDPNNVSLLIMWGQFMEIPTFNFTINNFVTANIRIQEVF